MLSFRTLRILNRVPKPISILQSNPRFFSSTEPSLEAMESFLLSREAKSSLHVNEIISEEILRIPSIDGMGIGSLVELSNGTKGVVLHFDKTTATIGLVGDHKGNTFRNMSLRILPTESSQFFRIPSVPFDTKSSSLNVRHRPLATRIPVVDLLLNQYVKEGMTVGLYGGQFNMPNIKRSSDTNVVVYPSPDLLARSGIDLYLDVFRAARELMDNRGTFQRSILVADFRGFEDACKSIEYQSGHPLPVSPKSLIASVLQLSHDSVSVLAAFNSKKEFQHEAEQSVDIGVEMTSGGHITNLVSILSRFSLKKTPTCMEDILIKKVVEGSRFRQTVSDKEAIKMFVEDWEKDEFNSYETMMRVLPEVARHVSKDISGGVKYVLMRSLCVLPFNKTSKLNSAAVVGFPRQLSETFDMEENELLHQIERACGSGDELGVDLVNAVDSALYQHRYKFEITNPLV